jgi:hypothetical protein
MAIDASALREAQRQQALIAAFEVAGDAAPTDLRLRESGARAARGLEAYRANAAALAERALAAVFATVRTMVGEDDFKHLAREFWHARPPLRGDMGEWGAEFPAWLGAHPAMAPWPYLGDCARLDLALHRNERAADAPFDAASLSLLESGDPDRLQLQLMPGVQVLHSVWPIATIHHAHQVARDEAQRPFEAVRVALAERRGEQVLVARQGWRAVVHRLDEVQTGWTQSLLDGASLGVALEQAGEGFDFTAWLGRALRELWLKGVAVCGD